ncbi:extracellular solute-binding protein [Nitratireductor sp. XY-223]|uniref:extracellular solute-binding protein n=1 Tax=Nitratireductor sp. XY-223 TaxID=2561926 RepID=UPI0010AA433B|nr:extracellular solute-binding protein [Nitratireductor sp. XY-223]
MKNTLHGTTLAMAVVLGCGLAAPVAAQAEELTISVWGGFYGENWEKDVVIPWEEKTGVEVTMDFGQSATRLSKALATRGRSADLLFITDHQMAILKERGLLDTVDPANVPNLANLHEFAKDPLGSGQCPAVTLLGVGLAYNKDHFDTPPTSWLDVQREDLETRPAFMDMGWSVAPSVMTHFATLQGGGLDNMDPAFNLIDAEKEDARFFNLFEVVDWINQGEVSIAPFLNIFARQDPNLPMRFVYPEDGTLGVVNMACILKDSPNKATAERFLNDYLTIETQEMQAKIWGEGPVVKGAKIPEDSPYVMVDPSKVDEVIIYDANEIASKREEWISRFQDIVAQ